jgi:8-oxo-dGTP diphosphatase
VIPGAAVSLAEAGKGGKMNQRTDVSRSEQRVAIALVRRGEQFLVGRRAAGQALEGYAEFPGGRCEPGESFADCVIREAREETGLAIRVLKCRQECVHDYPHGLLRLAFFDCELLEEQDPLPPFRWVSRHELADLQFPEGNVDVIAALLRET